MKKVYIILSKTRTIPARIIGITTRAKYTHSSIALVPSKHELYSFARRRLHNFLASGFLKEDTETFVFAKYPDAPCAVYELEVSDEGYERMRKTVDMFLSDAKHYKYNFTGMVSTMVGKKRNLKKKFTCSQFVSTVLESSGEVKLPKHPSLMRPTDLAMIRGIRPIYLGKLKNICFYDNSHVSCGGARR